MKKVFLSVLVAGVAITASAVTNAQQLGSRFAKTYFQVSPGVYSTTPSGSTCAPTSNPCSITYTNSTPTVNTFTLGVNDPAGARHLSPDLGIWQ